MTDRLTRFMIGPRVRGQWLDLQTSWGEVLARNTLPPLATRVLGELTAASLLLTATLKQRGSLTAQIVGGAGPARLVVVECQADGRFRSVLKPAPDAVWPESAEDLMRLLDPTAGARFVVTLDPQRDGSPAYQGIVPLEGASIAAALERYMDRSEQLPTRLWLAANGQRAAGLLLQRLPESAGLEADADTWERVQILADTLATDEILDIQADQAIQRLFWQENVSALESRTIRFACSCTRERVAEMLKMLGADEVRSILDEQQTVSVNCDYCNSHYEFDEVDCAMLFDPNAMQGPDTRQ
ncbi:MAG: Hsp33 family molecular chaperone HslO [Burkholderiaceae bacterium]